MLVYQPEFIRTFIHIKDLVKSFVFGIENVDKMSGEIYNIGGGRYSNCSVIEALNLVEEMTNISIKRDYIKRPRIGDHIWYISNISKFKKDYPNWKQKYNTKKILEEIIENFK